jgi:site-specific DNA-methyltransferase (cytosine-N4-specific)
VLENMPSESIDCVITSPPYWQLRDYGWSGQWGLESTYVEYLERLWKLMNELKRVLKNTGTVWINLGDTYFGSGNGSGQKSGNGNGKRPLVVAPKTPNNHPDNGLKHKCQVLIPHRFAIGCIERGWLVRNDIIWAKPNGMPESVKDRFYKRHEHIFLLTKSENYYFDLDAVRDPHKTSALNRVKYPVTTFAGDPNNTKGASGKGKKGGGKVKHIELNPLGKNPGDVTDFWSISTKPNSQKHYAAFNGELITKPILAGCPKGGIVLDPFCGTGTTGVRAIQLDRYFIGIDGKKEYCQMAMKNIKQKRSPSLSLPEREGNIKGLIKQLRKTSF